MQITSKQTLLFKVEGRQKYTLQPSKEPTFAPDYIRGTQLFKLATADGTIQEFVPVAAPVAPVDDKAKAKAAADKAKADADAEAKAEAEAKAAADKAAQADADAIAAKKAK
jgi:hypothetical protein